MNIVTGRSEDKTSAIMAVYETLLPDEKAKVDKLVALLDHELHSRSKLGKPQISFGTKAAIELIGKVGLLCAARGACGLANAEGRQPARSQAGQAGRR